MQEMTFCLLEWVFLLVNNISKLIDEIPQIINSKISKVLKDKVIKLKVVLTERFKKYHLSTNDIEFTEIVIASKNSIFLLNQK
jgi:transposase-like protein